MNKENALAIVDKIVEKTGDHSIDAISIIPDGRGKFTLKIFPSTESVINRINPILAGGKFTLTQENDALIIDSI